MNGVLNSNSNSNFKEKYFGKCRSVEEFEKIEEIGEGTYGKVFKARDKKDNKIYALKKIRMDLDSDGFPVTSIREIKILNELDHPNIIKIKEVVVGLKNDSIFLVFEYCDSDLVKSIEKLRSLRLAFDLSEIKTIMIQLLKAVDYLHRNYILHRDLKLSNILLNRKGEVKLADFGLSRSFSIPIKKYTPKVVTLWYRAPEILLNCESYSWQSDMWAIGCIFGELLNEGTPLLPGKNEITQFDLICELIGCPNEKIWKGFMELETSEKLLSRCENKYNKLYQKYSKYSNSCIDLLNQFLTWDPNKRISASEALLHDFFVEYPYPKQKNEISYLKYINI